MFKRLSYVWDNFKEYVVLIILVIISFVLLTQNNNPQVQKVRAVAFGSFAAVTTVIYDLFNTTQIRRENEELRKVNAELMLQVSALRQQGLLNRQLKVLAGFKDTSILPLLPATIVSRTLSQTQNTITINKGLINDIKPGMPVINHSGLVGIVHSTSDDFAIARTLKNINLKLTVKNERSRIDGIMIWDSDKLVIINVPKTFDFETGDRIVTSEISSIIPIPVPIGIVSDIVSEKTGLLNRITVEPFVDVLSIEYVFVLQLIQSVKKQELELNFYKMK
ncbi:MAG: rod shape-determining protein MreC [Ignavibacteria bacterium]|nr:rod shape-determining protein MreC [Ignavibacteria bacterium]MBT8382858.1 rod shape-determining protein MreC [Ignavibacteria bacterium]MBT8392859.1 rod shape-determining protein MreC [Ignavibacteria bacterium]NNJ53098.1 rod shape-determining protein MreC [Ignavibacteriaceae bacterium]NNL20640.1 rod shape-determining protein MreC [Ignavibacteriaceae bacterium]